MKETSLKRKIILYTIIVLLYTGLIIVFFTGRLIKNNVKTKIEANNFNTAINIANAPTIGDSLGEGDPDRVIEEYVDKVLDSLEYINMIVVADLEGKRYAHPNKEVIGEYFVGGDEKRVVESGEKYVSQATGTLGLSLRVFVPIYDSFENQVGFVMVGTLIGDVLNNQYILIKNIWIYGLIGLALGIIGAIWIASNIKKSLLDLEPHQITRLYKEKTAMLDSLQEGIIAIDNKANITTINQSALKILNIEGKEVIGGQIGKIFPNNILERVLETGEAENAREEKLNGVYLRINTVPIIHENQIIGVISTFKDKTETIKLAEEITGVNQIVDSLRSNTHEFMNKLHIILGLLEIGQADKAKKHIIDSIDDQQYIISLVTNKIKDPMVAALIIGKYNRSKEVGIKLILDENSSIYKNHGRIHSNTLVTIIGNFIENGIDALLETEKNNKILKVKVNEDDREIKIEVTDKGIGIMEEDMKKIFQRGFTKKKRGEGIGLYLVKENVERYGGDISISSKVGEGSKIIVNIPKEVNYEEGIDS